MYGSWVLLDDVPCLDLTQWGSEGSVYVVHISLLKLFMDMCMETALEVDEDNLRSMY